MADAQAEFMQVTGLSADRAKFFLESAAGDLQLALSSFYEDDNDNDIEMAQDVVSVPDDDDVSDVVGRLVEPTSSPAVDEDERERRRPQPPPPPLSSVAKAGRPGYSKYGSIYGLPKSNSDEDDDDEEAGQAFYAGGSERSGQQIIGPGKKPAKQDVVASLFQSAKEHGAETLDANDEGTAKATPAAFRGVGHKLGTTDNAFEVVASTSNSSVPREAREVTLKMWRNGFSVDEGPFRDYADPTNREFLNCIRQGEIPQELIRLTRGGEVSLNMEDHRQTDYEQPKTNLQVFSGTGHLLGSPVPNTATPSATPTEGRSASIVNVIIDETRPVTTVQIRLADGTKLTAKLNHDHTVGDLRRYITSSRPQYSGGQFALMTTFPNRELTDELISLKDADLLNAVIVQKLK